MNLWSAIALMMNRLGSPIVGHIVNLYSVWSLCLCRCLASNVLDRLVVEGHKLATVTAMEKI